MNTKIDTKISVIVPVYNVKKYVQECLRSLEKQTLQGMEVIIVDDGSTDGSGEICKAFIAGKENFRYLHKENGGLMSAWLLGVENAAGKYLGFVDSDDFVEPEMYETMLEKALAHDADVVMCNHNVVYQDRIVAGTPESMLKPFYCGEDMAFIRDHAFSTLCGFNVSNERWNKIIRRDVFVKNTVYCADKSRFHEAKYIVPACLFDAGSFAYVEKPLYNLRVRKSSNSHAMSPNLLEWTEHLFRTQMQMLEDKGLQRYRKQLDAAKVDYLRIVINRNLCKSRKTSLPARRSMAKELIASNGNRELVIRNKSVCAGKMGKLIYYSCKFSSPLLLVLGAALSAALNQQDQSTWFD